MNYPPALVLGKNYSPITIFPKLSLCAGEDAIRKYMNDKCEVLAFYDRPVLSRGEPIEYNGKGILFWPSVIVDYEQKIKNSVRLSLSVLYFRENGNCFWCQKATSLKYGTKDHVLPVSKGGENTFENLVFSCTSCNTEKADSLPTGRWTPRYTPKRPTYSEILDIRKNHDIVIWDETWLNFMPGFVNYRLVNNNEIFKKEKFKV